MHLAEIDHISVSICTYKRPELLSRLLQGLERQSTDRSFTYSITVVDNDFGESARETTDLFRSKSSIDIQYYVEPRKGIPLARYKAVANAKGNLVAFIDDDEFPAENWLYKLYETLRKYKADGVLGPVKPRFETNPPEWIIKAKVFERPSHKTGTVLHWEETRTGNVLLPRNIFRKREDWFNPDFPHGEDKDFFRRMISKGLVFVWCDEAPVYETERSERFSRSYFLKLALLRGNVSLRHRSSKIGPLIKSTIALGIYSCMLPFLGFAGHHLFMRYLVKDCDHLGRILRGCGINIEKYLL